MSQGQGLPAFRGAPSKVATQPSTSITANALLVSGFGRWKYVYLRPPLSYDAAS